MKSIQEYEEFLRRKVKLADGNGFPCEIEEVHPLLKPHQRDIVCWAVRGGRRAIFAAFGLGKSLMQLETVRLTLAKAGGGKGLIVCPLGVRQEFAHDAEMIGLATTFIRRTEEATTDGLYITNYESVRDGKLDPREFTVVSLDEAAVLRGFGGTKTFREFMRLYEGSSRYRFVATATPSPNEYIELLAYAAFLDIMDVGQAKTRFFKRDSTKADVLTLRPHQEKEFWLWIASWAMFIQKPSDLGHDDTGYELPAIDVRWHEVAIDERPGADQERSDGQTRMWRDASLGVTEAAREKRESLAVRVARAREIAFESPFDHFLLWHDLEDERRAITAAIPGAKAVWGSQDLDERETLVRDFSDGNIQYLAGKPVMLGSGCNFQRFCHRAIFVGIGFKFNEFIQAVHRVHRFLQPHPVRIDLIYTEAEREVRRGLERKWAQHVVLVEKMGEIIREYGLSRAAMADTLTRKIGVTRQESSGDGWRCVNNDSVLETDAMDENSVDLIVTSIPFSTQYEYTPSYNDFGHSEDNAGFWQQMDFLTPRLLRILRPGRVCAIHVKDRISPGGLTGLGFQTVQPFHAEAIQHYMSHGFAYLGMTTVVTDVVRENNQTYRLGWTEECKDGSRIGVGMPEYVLQFRKPPTDGSNGYADVPVVKDKGTYRLGRWQIDAHGFVRSSGDRLLTAGDLDAIPHDVIYKRFKAHSLSTVYDYEEHVRLIESLGRRLPVTFMLMPPHSWHPDVWTDVARMRTLNMEQERKGNEAHLCLARGSLVLTRQHGYIPIQDVTIGDHVLTHLGRWRPVVAVQNTGVRPAVSIHAHGVPGLTLTPDHKLWMRKTQWYGAERAEPSWVEAQAALRGYVNLKLPPTREATRANPLHWWIVGRWLADGHWDARGGAMISCGAHEVQGLIQALGEHAGGAYDTGTAHQIRVLDPDRTLKDLLRQCGHGAAGKHLPAEAFTLPNEQAEALLSGYMSGDGHRRQDRRRWMATSVSRNLLLGVAVLFQRIHGAIASVYAGRAAREASIEGRHVSCKQEWILSANVPDEERRSVQFIADDGAWKKVRRIEDAGEVETWNLRVEEDESFTAEGCIVKNCPLQYDIVDRIIMRRSAEGEIVFDPFNGIGTVTVRAVKLKRVGRGCELNARYWRDGVNYTSAAAREVNIPSLFDLDELAVEDVPVEAAS